MWAPGPPWGLQIHGHQAPNPQLPLRKEDVMASYASLSLAWSELGSAPEAIRSCYGWPPPL